MQFYSVLVEESKIICSCRRFIQGGYFKKKQFFHRWHQKSGFNLSTLRNRLQHLILLKFQHALNIFIKLLFAALVHFYSVLVEESKIICSFRRFIQGGYFKKKQFVHRWHQKSGFNLSTLRNRLQHLLLLKLHHTLNIFISFFCGAGALLLRFTVSEQYTPFISVIHPFEFFKRRQFFHGWDQKVGFNLSTLRNRFQRLLLLKFHHALKIFITFFCGPGALLLRFTLRGHYTLFISLVHPGGIF